ncbi:DHH family phosphoesterase [Desulfosediminicola sp.]|uniref:DHH family phosphoesterase n=1 Tax=Desulfosediminicola sp. TaxID=2886825 RepID=UPI003AF2ED8C
MYFDIFNGDGDGICALHQLRLAEPQPEAVCITGVKRDIKLLAKPELAETEDAMITVLDVSLDSNRDGLLELLARNNTIQYIDHHAAEPIPDNPLLTAHIDLSADTCTSLIVNKLLSDRFAAWAVCGAYGDNLHVQAEKLSASLGLKELQINSLREIGELLNYNGYGADIADLHFEPAELYRAVSKYTDPLAFHSESPELGRLRDGFRNDMERAMAVREYPNTGKNRLYFFPDEAWARRVSGVFANLKAREKMDAAHALITENSDSSLRISVRAPLNDKRDAVQLCKQFPTGGGREAAAGINSLPAEMLDQFIEKFNSTYP